MLDIVVDDGQMDVNGGIDLGGGQNGLNISFFLVKGLLLVVLSLLVSDSGKRFDLWSGRV